MRTEGSPRPTAGRIRAGVQVQDSVGEEALRRLLKLEGPPPDDRMSSWDGRDEHGNTYQLKTTTTGQVTTARDVGLHTIAIWRTELWIVAMGVRSENDFTPIDMRFLRPAWLQSRFVELEAKVRRDLELKKLVVDNLTPGALSDEQMKRLVYLLDRGSTLNNPKLSWKKTIVPMGLAIDLRRPAEHLREIVAANPV